MRIPILLSMIAVVGLLSGCYRDHFRHEITEIRGDCPEEAVRAAILDSRWRNLGMTYRELVDELNRYDEGGYESEEEYYQNYGRKARIRILRRIARTFERNIGRTVSPCRSEVRVHTFLDSGRIWRKYRFLLDHRNGRTLACHPPVCDKRSASCPRTPGAIAVGCHPRVCEKRDPAWANSRWHSRHPHVCDKSGDGRIVACGRYEDELEAYGICVDRQGEVK